jgi:hypothetical protein
VNLASLAGFDWARSVDEINAFNEVDFDAVDAFCERFHIEGARSYFFSRST